MRKMIIQFIYEIFWLWNQTDGQTDRLAALVVKSLSRLKIYLPLTQNTITSTLRNTTRAFAWFPRSILSCMLKCCWYIFRSLCYAWLIKDCSYYPLLYPASSQLFLLLYMFRMSLSQHINTWILILCSSDIKLQFRW